MSSSYHRSNSRGTTCPEFLANWVLSYILSIEGTSERDLEAEVVHFLPPAVGGWVVVDVKISLDVRFCSNHWIILWDSSVAASQATVITGGSYLDSINFLIF